MNDPKPVLPNLATAEVVGKSIQERIAYVRNDRWLGYDAAVAVINELTDLLNHPRIQKMPCRIITADSDNGKTSLLKRFVTLHATAAEESDDPHVPVVRFDAPNYPDEGLLYSRILTALLVAHRPSAPAESLEPIVIERLMELRVRMLLADEFHNVRTGKDKDTRLFLIALKGLLNVLSIPFVAAGTREAVTVLASDPQFCSRFQSLHLPAWSNDHLSGLRLLAGLGAWLPFPEPSNLHSRAIAPVILDKCRVVGDFILIVKESAILAIKDGSPSVTLDHVSKAIAQIDERKIKY